MVCKNYESPQKVNVVALIFVPCCLDFSSNLCYNKFIIITRGEIMNPLAAVKVIPLVKRFSENHPKLKPFIHTALGMIGEDSIVEIKITNAEGRTIVTNMKISKDDIKLVEELNNLRNE